MAQGNVLSNNSKRQMIKKKLDSVILTILAKDISSLAQKSS